MKIYSALIKKNSEGKIADLVLLKDGFSFSAFFFSGLWFLYHKMWREFLALFLVNFALMMPHNFLPEFDRALLQIAIILVISFNANHWLLEHLRKDGYEFIDLVFGQNSDDARFNFIKKFNAESALEFDDSFLNPKLYRKLHKKLGGFFNR